MQNTKDSFYLALRTRLATINPARTVLLRGAIRPGILVEEAEGPSAQLPADVFVLRWEGMGVEGDLASRMNVLECMILYSTSGSEAFGGLDRGRMLNAMDQELLAMLQPHFTTKMNYCAQPPTTMQTRIFWDEPTFSNTQTQRDRLSRTAKIRVYSYQEQGEA